MDPVLSFEGGTLTLNELPVENLPPGAGRFLKIDPRTGNLRGRACDYAPLVIALQQAGMHFQDHARAFAPIEDLSLKTPLELRPHQKTAFQAWRKALYRGVAALPTGSGKTILAVMATAHLKRPTLYLVPTLDLLQQWVAVLEHFFQRPIGMLGGGSHDLCDLTVSTYDSAVLNMEFIGNRFAFLVADECHHLPGPETRLAAAMSIAPFRLGLSATPELPDDRAAVLADLIGPVVCQIHIDELEGNVLSRYETRRIPLELDPDEAQSYAHHRKIYTDFLRAHQLNFKYRTEWGRFLGLCARHPDGRRVFQSFLEQRRIARGGRSKQRTVWQLIHRHAGERILIFTADNAAAYDLGRKFCWPVLTHRTRIAERKEFLDRFRDGTYPVLVTSKVLNEGVDVPAVGVGIILSGSASVREHVQRLGRLLRPAPGKKNAVLYELVSAGTGEENVSERRREHRAYRHH